MRSRLSAGVLATTLGAALLGVGAPQAEAEHREPRYNWRPPNAYSIPSQDNPRGRDCEERDRFGYTRPYNTPYGGMNARYDSGEAARAEAYRNSIYGQAHTYRKSGYKGKKANWRANSSRSRYSRRSR